MRTCITKVVPLNKVDISLLKQLSAEVDEYFKSTSGNKEARSTDIYDFIKKRPPLKSAFEDAVDFNRFLRRMHQSGAFRSIIKNSSVDTSNPNFYQWRFYRRDTTKKPSKEVNSDSRHSQNNHFKNEKVVQTNNGDYVRSLQEKYIYDRLLNETDLLIYYERPLKGETRSRYPDFTIANKLAGVVFHWEHFGLDTIEYLDGVPARLSWYKEKGYDFIENGGRLIMTQYLNQQAFEEQVEKMITLIKLAVRKD